MGTLTDHAEIVKAVEAVEPERQAVTLIRPSRGWQLMNVRELWRFRELVLHLVNRDIKVRYKQTALGGAWAILQPALMMLVFSLVFSRTAQSGGLPYPLFVLAGLLPWTFFATSVTQASNSIVNSEHLITKIYFPRLAIPLSALGAATVDFLVAFCLLIVIRIYYLGNVPFYFGPQLLLAPLVFALIGIAALGLGTLFAALNVAYRDFRYLVPFVVQLGLFATPSIYTDLPSRSAYESQAQVATETRNDVELAADSSTTKSGPPAPRLGFTKTMRNVLVLNPMTGLVAAFRASLLGLPFPWGDLGLATGLVTVLFLVGVFYFRRVEDTFPDII